MPVPETSPVTLYFPRAGDEADTALAEFLTSSNGPVRLAIYSLNRPIIVSAILEVKDRVKLITDHVQSFGPGQTAALRELQAAGVPIKTNHHSGLMHLKMAVRSDAISLGSFNYTNNAETLNDEVLAIIVDVDRAVQAAELFDCMWGDHQRFVTWHPPTAAELGAMRLAFGMPEF